MAQKRFVLTGVDELRRALDQAGGLADRALEAAMVQEAEAIMAQSKPQVPVDTGVLRASGTVLPPRRRGERVVVEMGYGGAASQYAIVQHERMDFNHTVGNAKFLERPFLARAKQIPRNLARNVERAWQRLRT